MNESQRRYTVNEINKYRSDVKALDKAANVDKTVMFFCLTLLIAAQLKLNKIGTDDITMGGIVADCIKYCSIIYGIDSLKNMVEHISKKAGLENVLANLDYLMKMDELANDGKDNIKVKKL